MGRFIRGCLITVGGLVVLAIVLVVLAALVTERNSPATESAAHIAPNTSTPITRDSPTPQATSTPTATHTPIPSLSFADFIQTPDKNGWSQSQYTAYLNTIMGRRTTEWIGTIVEVERYAGEPYLSIDMSASEPKIDAYVYISEDDFLKVKIGQPITFSGLIYDDWSEENGFYSLQIKDATLLELGELPTSTPTATHIPAPPTATTGPTPTPTPNIGSSLMAEVMCRQFVRERLVAPSTADFGGVFDEGAKVGYITPEEAASKGIDTSAMFNSVVWVVIGQVDSQNAFSAMIRSKYTCVMDYNDVADTWYLMDIEIK